MGFEFAALHECHFHVLCRSLLHYSNDKIEMRKRYKRNGMGLCGQGGI